MTRAAILLLVLGGVAGAQTAADFEHDVRALTRFVRERYAYLEHRRAISGLDLERLERRALVRLELEPTLRGFREAIHRYAADLWDGHGGAFVPGAEPARRQLPLSFADVAEGVVVDKRHASIVERDDVRRGDFVVAIDGVPIADAIARTARRCFASTRDARRASAIRALTATPARRVTLTLRRDRADAFTVELATRDPGDVVPQSDDRLRVATVGTVDDGIAYYRPGSFLWPRDSDWRGASPARRQEILAAEYDRIRDAFTRIGDARALVLDLRRNPGGTDLLGQALVAHLVEPPYHYFGLSARHDGGWSTPHYYTPSPARREPVFRGTLVVLIDEFTFSTASNVAACLRDEHPSCVFIGRRDGAGTGAPRAVVLPRTKTSVTFCTQRVYSPDGRVIEGVGVAPDVVVRETRAQLLAGEDAVLAAAAAAVAR